MGNIPHSPRQSSDEQNISKLDDFSFNAGTQPGQYESSLYATFVWHLNGAVQRKKSISTFDGADLAAIIKVSVE